MQVVRTLLRTWHEITETLENQFEFWNEYWAELLENLGLTVYSAWKTMQYDYESAVTRYNDDDINLIFRLVYNNNYLKYKKLITVATAEYKPIENYNMVENSVDTRTPDLESKNEIDTTVSLTDTRGTSSTTVQDSTNQINQTKTTTETPEDFGMTTIHSVNPYDNPGMKEEYQDVSTQDGSNIVKESYTGAPDQANTTTNYIAKNNGGTTTRNAGYTKVKETGSDTTAHTLTRSGNIGVTTSQQMLESELVLADKMTLFKIIEQDLASKIFLQVWL